MKSFEEKLKEAIHSVKHGISVKNIYFMPVLLEIDGEPMIECTVTNDHSCMEFIATDSEPSKAFDKAFEAYLKDRKENWE